MEDYAVLIPARLHSTRLPEKALADIGGAPMVVRVAQRVQQANSDIAPKRVVVATDSPRILEACAQFGIEAVQTATTHTSGSDRLAQACQLLKLPENMIVVNVQGDEPLIEPSLPASVCQCLINQPQAQIATAAYPTDNIEAIMTAHAVKVVCNINNQALYFSRAPIPWWRAAYNNKEVKNTPQSTLSTLAMLHIGIYAYRVKTLLQFTQLAPTAIEQLESLEQLRALWHGWSIAVHKTKNSPHRGVDTQEDLAAARLAWKQIENKK